MTHVRAWTRTIAAEARKGLEEARDGEAILGADLLSARRRGDGDDGREHAVGDLGGLAQGERPCARHGGLSPKAVSSQRRAAR